MGVTVGVTDDVGDVVRVMVAVAVGVIVTEQVGVTVSVAVGDGVGDELGLGLAIAYTLPSLLPMNSVCALPNAPGLVTCPDTVTFHFTAPVAPFKQTTVLSDAPMYTELSEPTIGEANTV